MKYLKKLIIIFIKILLKKLITFLIIIYAPLPFSNIFSFYNDLNNNDLNNNDFEYEWKDKLKIVAIGVVLICIFYIVLKNGNAPDSVLPNGNSASVKIQQQQIMQKRLDNALSVTQRILEIKKNKS